jgi:hypothetical protein
MRPSNTGRSLNAEPIRLDATLELEICDHHRDGSTMNTMPPPALRGRSRQALWDDYWSRIDRALSTIGQQTFGVSLDAIRDRTVRLICAITALDYLAAWTEACALRRAIQRAETIVKAFRDSAASAVAMRRLNELSLVAVRILDSAPNPSAEAVRQVRSSDWRSDRSAWDHDEQQWIAARSVRSPLRQGTTRQLRLDARPDTRSTRNGAAVPDTADDRASNNEDVPHRHRKDHPAERLP